MTDNAPPPSVPRPPVPTPPSIERAAQEHLDVIHELRELRVAVAGVTLTAARVVNTRTEDRLQLGALETRMLKLETKFDTMVKHQLALMQHFGLVAASG